MFRPDRGRKHLCHSERAGIIALSTGKSLREIADVLEISKSAVAYWQQRFRETGELKRKSGTGGKPKYNREDIVNIRSAVQAKPITTAQEIAGNILSPFLLLLFIKVSNM
jgi:transposase